MTMRSTKICFIINVLMISATLLMIGELLRAPQTITEISIYSDFKRTEIRNENKCNNTQQRLENLCLKYDNSLLKTTFQPKRDFSAQYKLNEKDFSLEMRKSKDFVKYMIVEDLRLYYLFRACEGIEDKYLDCQKLQLLQFSCNDKQNQECNDWERIVANVNRGTIRGKLNSKEKPASLIFPEMLTEIHKLNFPVMDGYLPKNTLSFSLRASKISSLSVLDMGRYLLALALTSALFVIVLWKK